MVSTQTKGGMILMIKRPTNVYSRRILLGAIFLLTAAVAFPQVSAAKGRVNVALWVANGTNVLEFAPGEFIKGTHDSKPHLTLNSAAFAAPQGVVFDATGNL